MKFFMLLVCGVLSTTLKAQPAKINIQNSIHYKSDLISESLIQNYAEFSDKEKTIYDKAFGTNVDIYIDTIFKKYTILFNDKDYKRTVMVFDYIRNYFLSNDKEQASSLIFLMEFQGIKFMLIDAIKLFNVLEVRYDEKLEGNYTHFFYIKHLEYVP